MSHRIQQLQQHYLHVPQTKQVSNKTVKPFKEILSSVQQVKVSKHAQQRLEERNIHIDQQQWQVIGEKMDEAKQKGITDSLVIMNQATLLVSTKNNTVVTAMGRDEATSRIFTNINGTILINE